MSATLRRRRTIAARIRNAEARGKALALQKAMQVLQVAILSVEWVGKPSVPSTDVAPGLKLARELIGRWAS